jgi:hypothetical protein
MPRKRSEVVAKIEAGQILPDVFDNWMRQQVKARSGNLLQEEEDEIDRTEDVHKKAHRRKRGKGAGASNP